MFPKPSPLSPPMFESRFIDRFSRTHFSIVAILYVPAFIWAFWMSLNGGVGVAASAALVAGGVLSWTLFEYLAHRHLFHWHPAGKLGERMHFILHGVHHSWPRDRFRLVMPPAVSISFFFIFLALFTNTMGPYAYAFHAGYTLGYMAYDLLHYSVHHLHVDWPWLKKLRKHHLLHHSPKWGDVCKFGVSTTLWDHVFGTYDTPKAPRAGHG